MQNMLIKSMYGSNFLGMGKFEQTFSNNMAIKGQNGKGKTSFYNLLCWILFGKDKNGKKLNPRPHNDSGEKIHDIIITGGVNLEIDGVPMKIERVQKESWSRGHIELTGNPEKFYINGVEMKANEYKKQIDILVDENIFITASIVGVFNSKSTPEKRKFLFNHLSKVDDNVVCETLEEYKQKIQPILALGKKVEDVLAQKKKELNEIKKNDGTFQARITENESKIQVVDVVKLLQDKATKTTDLRLLQEKLASQNSATDEVKEYNQRIIEISIEKSSIQRKLNADNAVKKDKLDKQITACEKRWNDLQLEQTKRRSELNRTIADKEHNILRTKEEIESLAKEKDSLIQKWKEKKAETFDTSQTSCPTCGHSYSLDKVNEMIEQFEKNKSVQLSSINERGHKVKEEIENKEELIKQWEFDKKAEREQFEAWEREIIQQKTDAENERRKPEEELAKLPQEIPCESDPVWVALDKEEEELNKKVERLQQGNSIADELISQQNELMEEINAIDTELQKQTYNENLQKSIQDIRAEQQQHEQNKADIMADIDLYERYLKAKAIMVEKEIDSYFSCIHWKLSDTLQNGNEVDCCECILKDSGSDYANASHGERMRMDLDIVKAIQNIYGIKLPVFVDDAESIDKDKIPEFGQVIRLIHTEDEELIFEL